MWRCDATRSAATSHRLPDDLHPLWTREFSPRQPVWEDPLNRDLMPYDRIFEPILMGNRLFIGFNDSDKLLALDADTGKDLWSSYAEAPVRMPAVGWNGRVYFCSDDGFLYCVQADSGELVWKFSGAPNSQHAVGNRRLTSAWPARGGPVVRDGTVYFAASIWPFMGTFLYALDAESGKVKWVNDSTGSHYIKQPHSAPSFAGVAPQGAIIATDDQLIVPGGRSVPAVFDRSNGKLKYFEINAGGKGTGGSFVTVDKEYYYVHTREKGTRAFNLSTGLKTAFMPNEPVIAGDHLYSAELTDKKKQVVSAYNSSQKLEWQIEADGSGDLILVGNLLFAAGKESITAIAIPQGKTEAKVVSTLSTPAPVERLIAGNGKLIAVTIDGKIIAYGSRKLAMNALEKPSSNGVTTVSLQPSATVSQAVAGLLKTSSTEGFAFCIGPADSPIVEALATQSPFEQFMVIDSDANRVDGLRRKLDDAKLYGRITAHHSDLLTFRAPSYIAHRVFVDYDFLKQSSDAVVRTWFESVRPYGGVMQLITKQDVNTVAAAVERLKLEHATIEVASHVVTVRRNGALEGAADWTHQYGDVANTLKSDDRKVKLPLGVLWFGGNSNSDILPRHGHGPPEQVVGGRLFIQGINSLSARDVYTGRVLWKRDFKDLGTYEVYFDATYEDVPLDPKYNQVHIPGANGRGTNYVVTDDRVYILEGSLCHVLDPATGATMIDIQLPADESGEIPEWGYIGVYGDVLIGGLGFAKYRDRMNLTFDDDKKLSATKKGFGSKSLDRAASSGLVGFDRHTGKQLWSVLANHSFWHNGIVAGNGKVFCLDKNPTQIEEAMKRRGQAMPESYRIVALNHLTGKVEWEIKKKVFGTWLGYSEENDLLLQASAKASDRLSTEAGQGIAVFHGKDGQLEWENENLKYAGPCILHNDLIITNVNSYSVSAGAYYLRTGKPKLITNPLTGTEQPWTLTRAYGCNNIIASENMLTFRSGAASFCDLLADAGTGSLGGFKSGCTSNLVVANGVLNAPDYTRTCSCAYQNQTSLALVHMPDVEVWSVDSMAPETPAESRVRGLAINFGAPGDRRDATGRLWIEYPVNSGEAPSISISSNPEAKSFQYHSSTMTGTELPWVLATGMEGISDLRIGFLTQKRIKPEFEKPKDDDDDDSANKKKKSTATREKSSTKVNKNKPSTSEIDSYNKKMRELPRELYDIRLLFALPPQMDGDRAAIPGEYEIPRNSLTAKC
ncbi:MAG: PQQ-binding-like beta-propeller repeat protein [Pirellulaceae bacterium]|nr:PQQ-binding-like beta-propeller repeat protein [Pirellulaceae bacterium]